jgi:hypothetical protein
VACFGTLSIVLSQRKGKTGGILGISGEAASSVSGESLPVLALQTNRLAVVIAAKQMA